MLKIFYRRFYILLFLVWLGASAGLFVASIWGDFGTFVMDFQKVMYSGAAPENESGVDSDVPAQLTNEIVHKARVARDVVRMQVSKEVQAVEHAVDKGVQGVKRIVHRSEPSAAAVPPASADGERQAAAPQPEQSGDGGNSVGTLVSMAPTVQKDLLTLHLVTTVKAGKVTRFVLNDPGRVVVDLRGEWENKAGNVLRFGDSFISRVVVGLHDDRLRLVFHFTDENVRFQGLPEFVPTENGLDIFIENQAR